MARFIICCILLQLFLIGHNADANKTIVIDPVPAKSSAKDYSYILSENIGKKINNYYAVVYTRDRDDKAVSMLRLKRANSANGDVLIGFRFNDSLNMESDSFRIFTSTFIATDGASEKEGPSDLNLIINELKKTSEEKNKYNQQLSTLIFNELVTQGFKSPDGKPVNSSDDTLVGSSMPAVLIDFGLPVMNGGVQEKIAAALVKALNNYYKAQGECSTKP